MKIERREVPVLGDERHGRMYSRIERRTVVAQRSQEHVPRRCLTKSHQKRIIERGRLWSARQIGA